jgi:hypothetical protein
VSNITTIRRRPKAWAWSYSKLKNFESCPKRHFHVDLARDVKEEESEHLAWGNAVHKAMAERLGPEKKELPLPMKGYEHWCYVIEEGCAGQIIVEQKLAINADFGPTTWFGDDAWYRAIGDVIGIMQYDALIVDWKTGKVLEDSQQLALMAACVFAHYPHVQRVRAEFIWLKEDAHTTGKFDRNEMAGMWRNIWPRIEALKHAHDTQSYPAKPGRLCRSWCPVTQCPHHGE